MAGHSQFKNIMHRKGAQDKKRGKVFTKLISEITVAAKLTVDCDANPRLRSAVGAARAANMPKKTIERAIKRGTGGELGSEYNVARYEGYGPGGVAIIVEALTDNRNRLVADVRAAFSRFGGKLGEINSVSFMFDRVGAIQYSAKAASKEYMFEVAVEFGAEDVESCEEMHEVICRPNDLMKISESLAMKMGDPENARLDWRPKNTISIDEASAEDLFKLLEALEDSEDIQLIAANYNVSEEVLHILNKRP